ncbi:MAG: hypothetical protein CBB68_07585 [Rhodospirillaceae bacterium TMED8]|nr:hypothetical protein [Magnetovibrio sp.]OUT50846.1 MAG: hypothetical protein CBB68_07585 [Rhodospirillaceae bacterium TMED8]|tara:strand:+ start:3145 stop:4506 length:1362 start_codon:yes stop_codon:yes gene_type:complete
MHTTLNIIYHFHRFYHKHRIIRAFSTSTLFLLSSFVFILSAALPTTGEAQQPITIAATVNDEMISILDIQSRLALSIRLANLADNTETRRRLIGQTLRSIIDQKLKLQAARDFDISVTRSEIIAAERDFERRAGLRVNGLRDIMKKMRLEVSGFLERLESEIAWSKLINRRYLPTIAVGEKELDDYLDNLKRNAGKPETLISEIFLPIDSSQNLIQVKNLAKRLISQIKSGANFAAISRNFSQSATAASGGILGWHRPGQLPWELDTVIKNMSEGEVAGPIKTSEGYYILRVEQRRIFKPFQPEVPSSPKLTLHQIHIPFTEGEKEDLKNKAMNKGLGLSGRAKNCSEFANLVESAQSPLSGPLGTFRQDELSQKLKKLVANLPVGQPSLPMLTASGVIVIMVCDRKEQKIKEINFESQRNEIRQKLINQRLNLAARQYLRNLHRLAIVEVRR